MTTEQFVRLNPAERWGFLQGAAFAIERLVALNPNQIHIDEVTNELAQLDQARRDFDPQKG